MGESYRFYGSKRSGEKRSRLSLSGGRVLEVGGEPAELEEDEVDELRERYVLRKVSDTQDTDNEDDQDNES